MKRAIVVLLSVASLFATQSLPAHADSSATVKLLEGDSCTHDLHAKQGKAEVSRSGKRVRVHVRATVGANDPYDIEIYRSRCEPADSSDTFVADADGTINKTVTLHVPTKYNRIFIALSDSNLPNGYLESHYFTLNP